MVSVNTPNTTGIKALGVGTDSIYVTTGDNKVHAAKDIQFAAQGALTLG